MKSLVNPAIAIAYLRVSTEDQALGPVAQRSQIEAWAARQGVSVLSWHQDQGVSGAAPIESRPGLAMAIHELRANRAGWLVSAKRDRFSRDPKVAIALEEAVRRYGGRLATADGAPTGDDPIEVFYRGMLDLVAQLERGFIKARTKAALDVKRGRGERIGTIPYGYAVDVDGARLVESPSEQQVITEARAIRDAGTTLRATASELNKRGHRSRAGTPFTHPQVRKMLSKVPR